MLKTTLTAVTTAAILFFRVAESCTCELQHPQQHACRASFVIAAKVLREARNGTYYDLNIKKVYKVDKESLEALRTRRVYTAPYSSLCRQELEVRNMYLLTGSTYQGKARINMCGFNRPWSAVTNRQRKGFEKLYGKGCDCQITPHSHGGLDVCTHDQGHWLTPVDCHSRHSVCLRRKKGNCVWLHGREYEACEFRQREP